MKWTDLALVFAFVFAAGAFCLDLSIEAKEAEAETETEYNQLLDAVAMDAFYDAISYEEEEGAVLDEEKILKNIDCQLCFYLGGKTSEAKMRILNCLKAVLITQEDSYRVYEPLQLENVENPWTLIKTDSFGQDAVRETIEAYLPGKLSVSEAKEEEWYQNIGKREVYLVFSAPEISLPESDGEGEVMLRNYTAISRGAARLEKRRTMKQLP